MAEYHVFMALPEDLLNEANEIARMQGISLTYLLIEALSDTVEEYQRQGWVAERLAPNTGRSSTAATLRMPRHAR